MIAKLSGTLLEISGNRAIVDTSSGVAYEVYLPPQLIQQKNINQKITLYTYQHVREDSQELYGFEDKDQKNVFRLLLSVSGVGPKLAFAIISFTKAAELKEIIQKSDTNALSQIPGLGRKTAMKIIIELSQKFDSDFDLKQAHLSEDDKTVVDALVSLGFKSQEARSILSKVDKSLSIEEKIKTGIRLASKKV